ncbi:MAG: hypothetical protein KKE20_06070 [Nanoarchaeota archaeon]|nr:hypothetical protein [Nanoarchaeota archaeon]
MDSMEEMMKMKSDTLRFLAIFMSCLIISIPFYVSIVNAQTLSEDILVTSVKGSNGVDNYRKSDNDFFELFATVRLVQAIPNPNAPTMVSINYPGLGTASSFSKCVQPSGAGGFEYNCSYKSATGFMPYGPGIYPISVCLTGAGRCQSDCSSCPSTCAACKRDINLYVDGQAPTVNSFDVTPRNTSGKGLTATYDIEDKLCAYSACRNKCSGLSKIELIDQGSNRILKTQDVVTTINDCRRSGTVTFDMTSVSDGATAVCIKAYDALGLASFESNNCIRVNKDAKTPVITIADIFDKNGMAPLRFVKVGGTQVKFIANITTSSLFGIKKATVDLTGFNLGVLDLSCTGDSGIHTCTRSLNLQVTAATTANIKVDVNDSGGNSVSTTKSITIDLDSIAPNVVSLLTTHNYNDTGYLGMGMNEIIALVNETGVGMAGSDVQIAVGTDAAKKASCTQAGNMWLCGIKNISASDDLYVTVTGADDAGNAMQTYTGTIEYDDIIPVLNNVTLLNSADYTKSYFFTGDDMVVRANIADNSAIKDDMGVFNVYGSFPGFASSLYTKPIDCFESDDSASAWICEWELADVLNGTVKASFSISDIVGNIDNSTIANPVTDFFILAQDGAGNWYTIPSGPVTIYPQNTSTDIDYWESSLAGVYPNFVDAETLRIIGHDVWFQMELTARDEENTRLLAVAFDPSTCSGDFDSFVDATGTFMVSPTRNYTKPWIKMSLQKNLVEKKQLKFNCTMTLISLRGGYASMPEIENITLVLPVESIGELGKQIENEIDEVENGPLIKIGNWIDTAAKLLQTAEFLCNIIYTLQGFAGATHLAAAAVAPLEGGPFDFVARALNGLSWVGEKIEKVLGWQGLSLFCAFVSCSFGQCASSVKDGKVVDGPKADKWYCKPYNAIIGKASVWVGNSGVGNAMGKLASQDFISGLYPEKLLQTREMTPADAKAAADKNAQAGINSVFGNPKNSLILSFLTLCIPGIIMNLKKARDIECQYLLCLKQQIPAGVPAFACTKMRSYQWCLFVWGEFFNIFPFTAFIKSFMSQITSILTDPGVIIGLLFNALCNYGPVSVQALCRLSDLAKSIQQILDLFEQMSNAEDMFKYDDSGICKDALEYGD